MLEIGEQLVLEPFQGLAVAVGQRGADRELEERHLALDELPHGVRPLRERDLLRRLWLHSHGGQGWALELPGCPDVADGAQQGEGERGGDDRLAEREGAEGQAVERTSHLPVGAAPESDRQPRGSMYDGRVALDRAGQWAAPARRSGRCAGFVVGCDGPRAHGVGQGPQLGFQTLR